MFTGTTFIFQNSEKKLFSSLNIYAVSIFFKGIVSSVFQQLNNFIDFILKVDLKIQIVCVYHYFYHYFVTVQYCIEWFQKDS